jgi:murein DD-endopeptidase MepM/ murein hydrolase activator NlpD
MVASVAWLAPNTLEPLAGGRPAALAQAQAEQFGALGIAPVSAGSATGLQMAETAAVQPLASAPERAIVDLFVTLSAGDTLEKMLVRSGAASADAAAAAALVRSAAPQGIAPGTSIAITLGEKLGSGARQVERVSLRASLGLKVAVRRGAAGLALQRTTIAVDTTPLRIRGRVGDGLYWSLRAAGVSAEAASAYLQALATQIDVGSDVSPADSFDLVMSNARAATGESVPGALLYAGLDRMGGSDLQLVKWPLGGRPQWVEADGVGRRTEGMAWPVAAPITSGFGMRVHPILRFARMHNGIDFGARWGTPIVAAADGQVVRAGWAGGYGQQVRLAHGAGLVTSYSHMSRIVAPLGGFVRQGQLIGYVGSTGLSTGPHLHYEVIRNGVPVNPLGVTFASRAQLEGAELEAFRARLRTLLSVGVGG